MEFINTQLAPKKEIIKVIGLGGAGSNAVNHLYTKYPNSDVIHICANTDIKHLQILAVEHKINLGYENTTRGLGAGQKVVVGEAAAKESKEEIIRAIADCDMLFIAAGMGGGTGTGSAPVVADIAKELGILTIAVVTKPFSNEGKKKMRVAEKGIEILSGKVNSLIVLPNDRLSDTLSKEILEDIELALTCSDDVLAGSVNAVTDIITKTGRMNVDFADIKNAMSIPGKAMISVGKTKSIEKDRAIDATNDALSNPLIEETNLKDVRGIVANITSSKVGLTDRGNVSNTLEQYAHEEADIKVGYIIDPSFVDTMQVTVILTGLDTDDMNGNTPISLTHSPHNILDNSTPVSIVESCQQAVMSATDIISKDLQSNDPRQIPAYLRNKQQA